MAKKKLVDQMDEVVNDSHVLDFVAEALWQANDPDQPYSEEALHGAGLILMKYKKSIDQLHDVYFESVKAEKVPA